MDSGNGSTSRRSGTAWHAVRMMAVILTLLTAVSCLTTYSDREEAGLLTEPYIEIQKDSTVDFSRYRTFSVFPPRSDSGESPMPPIVEKQYLFVLRNHFERLGYQFVGPDEEADLRITGLILSTHAETSVPPSTNTVTRWIPGRVQTTNSTFTGTVTSYGSGGTAWGTYTGFGTSTTYSPGYLRTETETTPGYTAGFNLVLAAVVAYDGRSGQNVWTGFGGAAAEQTDARVSGQPVLIQLVQAFPHRSITWFDLLPTVDSKRSNRFHEVVSFVPHTLDGNTYYPRITREPTSQHVALHEGDVLTAIDGESTLNMTHSQLSRLLSRPPGTLLRLDLLTSGYRRTVNVTVPVPHTSKPPPPTGAADYHSTFSPPTPVARSRFEQLELGWRKDEVANQYGKPDRTRTYAGGLDFQTPHGEFRAVELWYYGGDLVGFGPSGLVVGWIE